MSVRRFAVTSLAAAVVLNATVACGSTACRQLSRDIVVREFYRQSAAAREASFNNYAFEDRYRIYIYGVVCRHPPTIYLERPFAQGGAEVATRVQAKLAACDDAMTIGAIVDLFHAMKALNTYNVQDNQELVDALRMKVGQIEDLERRQYYEGRLERMLE
jgi:hypothetical protein